MGRKAAQGSGTIRKKIVTRNGKKYEYWEARYTVGRDPGTGKQLQRSITGKSQKEVAEKLRSATAAVDDGTYIAPCKLTLGQWLDIWARDFLGGVKPQTLRCYKAVIANHLKPALGAVRLDALTPHAVQRVINALSDGTATTAGQPLAPKTVKVYALVLHAALAQAVKLGYIRANPCDVCTLPHVDKKEIHPLDEGESRAFLDAAKGDDLADLFTVALFTGMRKGELLGLTWACVDFKAGTVKIDRQLQIQGGRYCFTSPKSGKPRTITPAPFIMSMLKHRRAVQSKQRLRAGEIWEDHDLVFSDGIGGYLSGSTLYAHFKKIADAIGRPDLRFHDLRHSYAVAALRAGDDVKTVQGNLGHSTAAFTLDVYGHVTERMKTDSAQRMEKYIEDVMNL